MKLIALAAFVIAYAFFQALGAQTLAPVDAGGFNFWPLVAIAIVGAAAFGLYLWHKRNPSQADAALHSARVEASELAHKAVEAVQTLVKTNREQAMVIASPPVQATINAGAPITPRPPAASLNLEANLPPQAAQIAPGAAISPAPVSSPMPAVAGLQASNATIGAPAMPATDVQINPADYPAIDPATGRLVDNSLLTSDPQAAHLALNIWARQYGIQLMTDYQLRQAALYDSQRNRLLARNLLQMGFDNVGVQRMLRSPEQVYYALLKKKASGAA